MHHTFLNGSRREELAIKMIFLIACLQQFISVQNYFMVGASLSSFIQNSKILHKRQFEVWRIECEFGIISDPECPIDGGWTPWEPWSPCHGSCDVIGQRRRIRQCTNPPPSKDGMPCSGPEEEIESCYLTKCTSEDFRKLIEGDSSRIQAFDHLQLVPALMERCLQTECVIETIKTALASDNTWQLDPESLWNALLCVKHNLGCHVIGEWGSWGPWTPCGARCGHGHRWRVRRCDTPPPSNAQLVCSGSPLQAEECEGDQCAVEEAEINNLSETGWSEWTQWSPCSEQCGVGVRKRRRFCHDTTVCDQSETLKTHCVGQHEDFEVCSALECKLDGGWSGWSTWGPCSQTCGAGRRHRTRSCTRPVPAGGGTNCVGPKTEFGTCYLSPCDAFPHIIVVLNGDSYMQYNFEKKRSTMFHFYVRFLPLSPHGTLVRRGSIHNPLVRLSLQKWHICLDASGSSISCTTPRICSPSALEPAAWHSALISVSNKAVTLRLDDASVPIQATFSCDPELSEEKMNVIIGQRLHGEIQEMSLNFIPLHMFKPRSPEIVNTDFLPTSSANLAFEKANIDEAYLILSDGQYVRVPCFNDQDDWEVELTIKPKRDSGTVVFLKDDKSGNCLHLALQNARLILKISAGKFRSESICTTECPSDQWLDVILLKKRNMSALEVSINKGEKLHGVLEEEMLHEKREIEVEVEGKSKIKKGNKYNFLKKKMETITLPFPICSDEFFLGGFPSNEKVQDENIPLCGTIASLSINNNMLDLHTLSVERHKDDGLQVSSKTASVSGSYHEISWGKSNRINLTCLYARSLTSPKTANWLYLDSAIKGVLRGKTIRQTDDGRILRLDATANNELSGFYTCRAHSNRVTRNIVTYGIVGKIKYNFEQQGKTGAFAFVSTSMLVLITLAWLTLECYYDLRTGFGFFRDAHLSPDEEAEAVCNYIDSHIHLIGPIAAKRSKAKARLKAREKTMASKLSFAAQQPDGEWQSENPAVESFNEDEFIELRSLPALPEDIKSSKSSIHKIFRCEQSYVSSPRHGTITSPRTKAASSSSLEMTSPHYLCNRLLLSRKRISSKDTLWRTKYMRNFNRSFNISKSLQSNLQPIQSSSHFMKNLNESPAKKVLLKFQQLRSDS